MNRILATCILLATCSISWCQQSSMTLRSGFGLSRADINGFGRMLQYTSNYQFKNHIVVSGQIEFGYFEATGTAFSKAYTHSTHYGDVQSSIGYQFNLHQLDIDIVPHWGVGIMFINAQGEFTNELEGQKMYNTFGPKYFKPKFTQVGHRYCTEQRGYTIFMRPSITLAKNIKPKLKAELCMSYTLLGTDAFDAYIFPSWSNASNDHFMSATIGISWIVGKRQE